jgi:prophage tail gpP-like protein
MSLKHDDVRLKLASQEVFIASEYDIRIGVFEQPGAFSMTVGNADNFASLASRFPPKTPYELLINGVKVQTGETDGLRKAGSQKNQLKINGRDRLARLVDTNISRQRSFQNSTYLDITREALADVGLGDVPLTSSNEANRKAISGFSNVQELVPPTTEDEIEIVSTERRTRRVYRTLKAELGTTWWQFLTSQYRRAGLFLWSDVSGGFVLASPESEQVPVAQLTRQTGVTKILNEDFSNDTSRRHSEAVVYGRNAGGKNGVGKVLGRFVDDEMVAYLNPNVADRADGGVRKQPATIRDSKVRTRGHAQALARRVIAEERRRHWRLRYEVAGHSTPAVGGGRVVWAPDTIVDVNDGEMGIQGPMYVESIQFSGKPTSTTTWLNLVRTEDLFFRSEALSTARAARPKLKAQEGVVDTKVFVPSIGTYESNLRNVPGLGDFNPGTTDSLAVIDELGT